MKQLQSGWWVLAWNPVTLMWTRRSWHRSTAEAVRQRDAFTKQGVRARLLHSPRLVVVPDPAPAPTLAARFREQQAAQMSDRADAMKRYKSMG